MAPTARCTIDHSKYAGHSTINCSAKLLVNLDSSKRASWIKCTATSLRLSGLASTIDSHHCCLMPKIVLALVVGRLGGSHFSYANPYSTVRLGPVISRSCRILQNCFRTASRMASRRSLWPCAPTIHRSRFTSRKPREVCRQAPSALSAANRSSRAAAPSTSTTSPIGQTAFALALSRPPFMFSLRSA